MIYNGELRLPQTTMLQLKMLEKEVVILLTKACRLGRTYIITNASEGWVESSAQKFMPSVYKALFAMKITIISARS